MSPMHDKNDIKKSCASDLTNSVDAGSEWNGRAILLLDLDAFFASVEQLDHPEWRGKPVIVGGDADKRGVVATASYEARTFGVHSAMPSAQARRLCPHAIWTHGHFSRYREMSNLVMDLMRNESPFLQQVSIDEAFLDVSPTRINRESPIRIAERLQDEVKQLGVTCSIGLGISKAVAKTASEQNKPQGLTVVYPGTEQAFLSPLPIARMSGIGPAAQAELKKYGIATLGDVVHADEDILRRVFGINAEVMRARCAGRDTDLISKGDPAKSISNEMSFARNLTEEKDVEAALGTICDKVARRLRKNKLYAQTLTLKIRYNDLHFRTARQMLHTPTNNEFELHKYAMQLLPELWSVGTEIRLLGIATSHFVESGEPIQTSLFDFDDDSDSSQINESQRKKQELSKATDLVRDRFGENAVQFGHQIRTNKNLTGTAPKNPSDYKKSC